MTIALDIELTPELLSEGIARNVVRVMQNARMDAGLDVSECISLSIAAPEDVTAAIRQHENLIAHETLATSTTLAVELADGFTGTVGDGIQITVQGHRN